MPLAVSVSVIRASDGSRLHPEAGIFHESPSALSDGIEDDGGNRDVTTLSPTSAMPSAKQSTCDKACGIVEALGTPPSKTVDGDAIQHWVEKTPTACRKALLGYGMHAELVADGKGQRALRESLIFRPFARDPKK